MKYFKLLFLLPFWCFAQTFSTYETSLISQCIDGSVSVHEIEPQQFECLRNSCVQCDNIIPSNLSYRTSKTKGSVSSALDLYVPKYNTNPWNFRFERESPFPYYHQCSAYDLNNDKLKIQTIEFEDCHNVNPYGPRNCEKIILKIKYDSKNKQVRYIRIDYEDVSVTVDGIQKDYDFEYPYSYRGHKMTKGKHVQYYYNKEGLLIAEFVGVPSSSQPKREKYYNDLKELYRLDFSDWSVKYYWKDVLRDKSFVEMLNKKINKEEFQMIFYTYENKKLTEVFKCNYNERENGEVPVFEKINFEYNANNLLEHFERTTRHCSVYSGVYKPKGVDFKVSFNYNDLNHLVEKRFYNSKGTSWMIESYEYNSSGLISSFNQDYYTTKNDSTYIWNSNTHQIIYEETPESNQ